MATAYTAAVLCVMLRLAYMKNTNKVLLIAMLLPLIQLCYSNSINVRLYSNGGDVFDIKIENNLLYITDSLVLKYIPEQEIYYYCKIINSNPSNWQVYKKEYTVSLIKMNEKIEKAFISVKTYFDDNRLAQSFMKVFYKNPSKSDKIKYILCINSSYSKDIVINKLEDILSDITPHGFSELTGFSLSRDTVEFIDYNDNTIWFLDNAWDLYLIRSFKDINTYSGRSLFASCIHDYCYVKLIKKDSSYDVFYYESGDGGAGFWGANYHIVKTTIEDITMLNEIIEEF
jgi:hypothetical protein